MIHHSEALLRSAWWKHFVCRLSQRVDGEIRLRCLWCMSWVYQLSIPGIKASRCGNIIQTLVRRMETAHTCVIPLNTNTGSLSYTRLWSRSFQKLHRSIEDIWTGSDAVSKCERKRMNEAWMYWEISEKLLFQQIMLLMLIFQAELLDTLLTDFWMRWSRDFHWYWPSEKLQIYREFSFYFVSFQYSGTTRRNL